MAGLLALFVVASMALTAGSASAARTHVFKEAFGTAGHGDGAFELAANSGLAVNDETHDVYVADTGNHRVVEFSAAGTFIRAFGADVGGPGVDVCTTACAAGTAGSAPGQFEAPTFIAVDNAPGGAGSVYVADTADHFVTKFEADGTLVAAWGNNGLAEAPNGQLVGATQAEPFGAIAGIAVDSAGNLDVLREFPESVVRFLRTGSFVETVANPRGNAIAGLGVDSSGNFFKVNGNRTVEKFEPNGGEVAPGFGQVAPPGEPVTATGLAVDSSSGELLVDTGEGVEAFAFSPSGEVVGPGCTPAPSVGCPPSGSFGAGHLSGGAGLAVDSSTHDVYAASATAGQIVVFSAAILPDATTEAATAIGVHQATLHGMIDAASGPEATCRFQYTTEAAFESNGFQGATTAPCAPVGPFTGTASEAVAATVAGLAAGTPYVFRLVGENEVGANPGSVLDFQTIGPQVVTESASEVTATTAKLETEVNPHGTATTYRFQYGTTPAYGSETPAGSAGSGTADVTRGAFVSGLQPATTYHYRVLAESHCNEAAPLEVCVAEGPDRTFTTQPAAGSSLLPDGRGWELVSPALKQGIPLGPITVEGGIIQAAADGSAITYYATGSIVPEPAGNRSLLNSQDLSSRGPAGGWSTIDISTPHQQAVPVAASLGNFSEYKLFSSDLSSGAVEPFGATPLSPQAGEKTIYLRSLDGSYEPLVNSSNVPFGTHFGGTEAALEVFNGGVEFKTATPDLSHILLTSAPTLVEGFETEGANGIYEWSGGALTPVSFTPPGTAASCAGSACVPHGGEVGNQNVDMRNAISTDGSRVIFSNNSGEFFLRDLLRGETLRL
ncbi:MAG TPA: hypothetical protein VGO13_05705, partial [Solirubrobacterales bacterium]|nr:hypothetical protein [Solirubrobacterales bacterium]